MLRALAVLLLFTATAHAEVIVGVVGPLSGQYQSFGTAMLNGVKAAVDKLNGNGGLGQEPLAIISLDDQCDTVKAREAAAKLISQSVDVVIGHFCSNTAVEAAKAYEKAGIPMLAPTAGLPALTEQGFTTIIRLSTRLDAQGAFAAQRILVKRPNAKLALVDDGSTDMKAIIASFQAAYGKPPALAAGFTPEAKDFAEILAKLKAFNIDTIYIAAQAADAGRLTAQIAKAGLDIKRYGPDALLAEGFWTLSGPAGENTLVSFPTDPENTSEAKVLARDMKAIGQVPEGPFLPAYAAVQLFAAAAERSGAHGHAAIATALKSGSAFPTLLGPMRFDDKGDGMDLRFTWQSWNNGSYQMIAGENP